MRSVIKPGKNRGGQLIVVVAFVIVIFALLGLVVASQIASEGSATVQNLYGIQALNVAEAGLRYMAENRLLADMNWANNPTTETLSFGPGSFTITYATPRVSQVATVDVTGTVNGVSRTVQSTFDQSGSLLPFNVQYIQYDAGGGGQTLTLNGAAQIIGDFYYNGPIAMGGSATQTGGVLYSTSLSVSGGASYTSWEVCPAVDMPAWDNSYYDLYLSQTASNGANDPNLGYGQSLNLNGGTAYYKSFSMDYNATVNGPGTIVATGLPSGTGDINISYGPGIGPGIRFIAAHNFNYQGGNDFVTSVEVYAKNNVNILNSRVIQPGSILYSKGSGTNGIDLEGPTTATILCPYGTISTGGGYIMRGLLYCNRFGAGNNETIRGAIICYSSTTIGNSMKLIEDSSWLPKSVIGLSGELSTFECSGWGEIY